MFVRLHRELFLILVIWFAFAVWAVSIDGLSGHESMEKEPVFQHSVLFFCQWPRLGEGQTLQFSSFIRTLFRINHLKIRVHPAPASHIKEELKMNEKFVGNHPLGEPCGGLDECGSSRF